MFNFTFNKVRFFPIFSLIKELGWKNLFSIKWICYIYVCVCACVCMILLKLFHKISVWMVQMLQFLNFFLDLFIQNDPKERFLVQNYFSFLVCVTCVKAQKTFCLHFYWIGFFHRAFMAFKLMLVWDFVLVNKNSPIKYFEALAPWLTG